MNYFKAVALLATLGLAGCASQAQNFGAPLSAAPAIPALEVLTSPENFDGKSFVMEGTVAEVCQNKGCWLTVVSGEKEMRVRFKDYAFFVPKDCSGQKVRLDGVFTIEMVPVEEARHYLEDAGKPDEAAAITEPVPGFSFLASGVRLLK